MALYSCSISNIKRSDGRSSVAKAAYNSRSKLEDLRTGNIYNYSQKEDLGFSEIITPKNAPEWASERQKLWSKNELANKRRDARVAKEILVALPRELDTNEQLNLVRKFVAENLTPLGVVADVNAHELDPSHLSPEERADWNPHAHILISTQHIENGEFGRKITELNQKDFVVRLRESWANQTNKALEAAGSMKRVDHRSNQARGIDRIPQIHLGSKVWAMKQKGIATDRGDRHLLIEERNQEAAYITASLTEAIESKKVVARQLDKRRISGLDVVRNSMSESNKSWWKKAKDFVFRSKKDSQDFLEPITKTTNVQEDIEDFSLSQKEKPKLKSRYPDVSQSKEEKLALAKSLVKQIDNQGEINKQLRTKVGKLVVLVNKNKISVFSLMFSGGREQQEKLILERRDTGWEITKYKLSNQQRTRLLEVLKTVESKKSVRSQSEKRQDLDWSRQDQIEGDYLLSTENSSSTQEQKSKGFQR